MKVREDSHARLVVEDRPWLMALVLVAAILGLCAGALFTWRTGPLVALSCLAGAALFGAMAAFMVRRVIVIFDRATGRAVWREARLRGQREEGFDLSQIAGTVVQTQRSTGRKGRPIVTARVALRIAGRAEPFPLTVVYSSGPGAGQAAEAIDRWLAAGR